MGSNLPKNLKAQMSYTVSRHVYYQYELKKVNLLINAHIICNVDVNLIFDQ